MLNQNLSKNSLTLLSDIPLAIIEWDSDCRIKQWNSQAEKIFGWTPEEAIGQHAFFLIPAHLKPMISDIFSQLYTQTGGLRNLNENLRKDGEIITCEWYNKPFFDEQNQLISIVSLIKDISLETELREQIDAFLSTVAGLASYIDFNLRYEAVNGKMAEYLGLNPQELVGQEVGKIDENPEFRQTLERFIASHRSEGTWEIVSKIQGKTTTFIVSAKKCRNGMVVTSVDITDRKNLEMQLKASEERSNAVIKALPQVLKSSSIRRSTESFETLIQQLTDDPVFSDLGIRELSTSQIEKLVKLEVEVRENSTRLRQIERSLFTDQNSFNNRLKELEVYQESDEDNWKEMEADLFPFRTFGRIVKATPGGLKTWLILIVFSTLLSTFIIDLAIRYYDINLQDLVNQIQRIE